MVAGNTHHQPIREKKYLPRRKLKNSAKRKNNTSNRFISMAGAPHLPAFGTREFVHLASPLANPQQLASSSVRFPGQVPLAYQAAAPRT
jgi:hypothetical protein